MRTVKVFPVAAVLAIVIGLVATTAASSQSPCITQWCGENNPTGVIFRQGKVGIGTQTPTARLHVNGVTRTGFGADLPMLPSSTEPLARLSSTTSTGPLSSASSASALSALQFNATASIAPKTLNLNDRGSVVASTASIGVSAIAPSGSRLLVMNAENQDMPISFRIGGSEKLRINPDGTVEIISRGIKFPDGTIQGTATLRGLKGDKGEQGSKGDRGEKGDPGRDANVTNIALCLQEAAVGYLPCGNGRQVGGGNGICSVDTGDTHCENPNPRGACYVCSPIP